ncbi:MAG: HD domain-containing protein, partial [Actinobacteria bacterium]|nr:HD domain-containing protein [Actinomycetota bacterium]
MTTQRVRLLADESLRGSTWCRAHSNLIDQWLTELLQAACGPSPKGVALAAIGGYGRQELSPGSDIDVLLLHDRRVNVAPIADRVWYPVWDEGLQLGHRVTTIKEELKLASDDLDTATSLLELRHVAGDETLTSHLTAEASASWEKRSKRWLAELADRVDERHARFGEVAFRLEPDLKEGRGGLRDVHALKWAEASHRVLLEHDDATLAQAYSVILDARVELQRLTGRQGNVLALQEQPAVAKALGDADVDEMIARITEAARTVAWTSDDAFRRVRAIVSERPALGTVNWGTALGHGMVLRLSALELTPQVDVDDPLTLLRAAKAAATNRAVIERNSLEMLVRAQAEIPDPWPEEMRSLFVGLLRTGSNAIEVIEALDQRGLWSRLIPQWRPVQAKPQHNAYHLYTVDRHLLETVAHAAELTERVTRPDLLMVVALLHDIGKGYDGDHSVVGAEMIASIGARMGFSEADCQTLSELVRWHLLLPDVATRRDLDDP